MGSEAASWECVISTRCSFALLASVSTPTLLSRLRNTTSLTPISCDSLRSSQIGVDPEDKDGLFLVEKFSSMLFTSTDRVKEAARLLRSSVPIFLKVERPPEVTDHEYEQRKQAKLLLLCSRSMAAPIGRGMLTLGTCSPLLAEALPIPQICLAGRVPPTNATMQVRQFVRTKPAARSSD